MHILRIVHPVPDFDGRKKAFASDPAGRKKSSARRYQVLRTVMWNPQARIVEAVETKEY